MRLHKFPYTKSPSPLWLLICVALIFTLAAVAYVATQVGLEGRKKELETTLKNESWRALQVMSAGALEPVISEDIELLNTLVLESVQHDSNLHSISIYNESKEALFSWTDPNIRQISEIYTYEKDIDFEGEKFGSIVASWNPTKLLEKIKVNFVEERNRLITALFTLTVLSLLLLHGLVVAPLSKIRNRLESLSEGVQLEPLEINSSRDLSMLATVINELDTSMGEARQLSLELEYQATHDSLTGLISRYAFEKQLKKHLENRESNHAETTLLYIDLDQFKLVNDTCGHVAGDALLTQLSTVLKNQVKDTDVFARLGGDEFAVLLANSPIEQGLKTAEKIRNAAQAFRFSWEGKTFTVETSIGAVPINSQHDSFESLLLAADEACYSAKSEGRNRVHCYFQDDQELRERRDQGGWIPRIIKAIDSSRLVLYGQPIEPTDIAEKQGGHVELLVRMLDDANEIIPPGAFLPAAERYGLMPQIDKYVITQAISWLGSQVTATNSPPVCAINLSGHSICDPNFRQFVFDTLKENTHLCSHISFEITETSAVANLTAAIEFIHEVKRLGCAFALDDFGAGMSSFTYLKNLPVDYVKIDGSFVKNILTDPISLSMVRAIADIVDVMKIQSIAEYVENQDIRDKLLEIGIDYVQGFGVAKPASLIEFEAQKNVA